MIDQPGHRREPADSRRERHSTYFVQDKATREEMTRLHLQDQMFTRMTGSVLPDQPDPSQFERLLDVGCGTGGWLIEVAKAYPSIKQLVGVDINQRMIDFARQQAKEQQVEDRVEFQVMDALHRLQFPDHSFHLVNHRLGMGWLRTWEWPRLLTEYERVTRESGTIRITESDIATVSSSPAHLRLNQLLLQAFYRAGNFFTPQPDGLTSQLAALLRQYAGVGNPQTHSYAQQYQAGTPEWQSCYDDCKLVFRVTLPFMRKWTQVPDDYEQIYQQMLSELQQPDFRATWNLLTAWGTKGGS